MRRGKLDKVNFKIISIIILLVFFLMISVGYSYLRQQLNIYGKSTKIVQDENNYTQTESTYSWNIVNTTKQEDTIYTIYNIKLNIVNMDEDIYSWRISFDIPEDYQESMSNISGVSSVEFDNGQLVLLNDSTYVAKGNSIDLDMQIALSTENFSISNLALNGKTLSENK